MYSLLLYNERDMSPIQYTKKSGVASLVDAIRKMQEKYNTPGHYRIQFATCLCKVVARSKRKKLKKNYGHKQDYKAMKPPKKKIWLEKN